MPNTSPPPQGVMEAEGAYNKRAKLPAGGAALALPLLDKAVQAVEIDAEGKSPPRMTRITYDRLRFSVKNVRSNHENPSLQALRARLVPGCYEGNRSLPGVQEHGLEEEDSPSLQTLWARLEPSHYEIDRSLPGVQKHGLEEKLEHSSFATLKPNRTAAPLTPTLRDGIF